MAELTEQEQIRRNSLAELKKLGINPYPAALYEVNCKSAEILEKFPQDNTLFQNVSIAGRIMSRRIMGAASFASCRTPTAASSSISSATRYAPARTRPSTTPSSNACSTSATSSA